ncbi:MAG: HEPN domain-containing protein [Bacteroidales bacterium]|nr:HEPN domain-containing protein [Bacteroidales bacterium]
MSLSKEERKAIVEFRIEKAFRAFNEAKGVIQLGYWETIANRLYYAAYNAASALLIANGDSAQSHSGVIHLFGLRFIKTGIFSSDMGKLFHSLFTMRQTGDYDDTYGLTEDDVMPNVNPTEKFIEKVATLAKQYLTEDN